MIISKLEKEIEETTRKLVELQTELDSKKAEEPVKLLAMEMHEHNCTRNHTDGCGWHYEITKGVHDWTGNSHSNWLAKAQKTLQLAEEKGYSEEKVFELFKIFSQVRRF